MYNHFTFKETNKTMDKNIIRYAIKDVFKKTKIICPNCGTIQDYKNIKCSKCNQSLDGLKDNTLKVKNCIRVGSSKGSWNRYNLIKIKSRCIS